MRYMSDDDERYDKDNKKAAIISFVIAIIVTIILSIEFSFAINWVIVCFLLTWTVVGLALSFIFDILRGIQDDWPKFWFLNT